MKIKQQKDIETCLYFMPSFLKHIQITGEDKKKYLEWSENGLHKQDVKDSHFTDGFNSLISGKQWRARTMEMWREGIIEGSFTFKELTEDIPQAVRDFVSKELWPKNKETRLVVQEVLNQLRS